MYERKLIDKYIGFIEKYKGDSKKVAETLTMACQSLKKAELIEELLCEEARIDPYPVLLVLRNSRRLFDDDTKKALQKKVEEIAKSMVIGSDENNEMLINLLAAAVLMQDEALFHQVYEKLPSEELSGGLIRIFTQFFYAADGSGDAVLLLTYLYELMDYEMQIELMKTLVFDKSVFFYDGGYTENAIDLLAERALKEKRMKYLYALIQFVTCLHTSHVLSDADRIMETIFTFTDCYEIYYGMLLTEDIFEYEKHDDIVCHENWWALVCKYERADNPTWAGMRGWYEMYILSRRIYFDHENAQKYIEEAAPIRETVFLPTTRSVKTVHGAVETLIKNRLRFIPEYLEKIKNANIYRFYSGCARRDYCDMSSCTVNVSRLVPMLAAMNYSRKEIISIYLNTFMRRLVRFDRFLRQLFKSTGTSNQAGTIKLDEYFGKYAIPAKVTVLENGNINLEPKSLNIEHLWVDNVWKKENPAAAKQLLVPENEISVRLICCDIKTFTCRAVPVDSESGAVIIDNHENGYNQLLEYLDEVKTLGKLTTATNLLISSTVTNPLTKEQNIKLNTEYLECCAAIAEKGNDVRYFINMITSPKYKAGNPFKHNRMSENMSVKYYSRDTFICVMKSWDRLKASSLSADDLFYVYINTVLKHCVSFSNFILSRFNKQDNEIMITDLLTKYTDYYFSGVVIHSDTKSGIYTVEPTELSVKGKFGHDRYICSMEEKNRRFLPINTICHFKISSYNPKTNTFVVTEFSTDKKLRNVAPDNIFINSLFNAGCTMKLPECRIRDINADNLKLSRNEMHTATDAILSAMKLRLESEEELMKFMAILNKNNPWRFGLEPYPDLKNHTHQKNLSAICQLIADNISSKFSEKNMAVVYFNSPMRAFIPIEQLVAMAAERGRDTDALLYRLSRYPISISEGVPTNCTLSHDYEKEYGCYTLFTDDCGFNLMPCESPDIPTDFTDEQLQQIIKDARHKNSRPSNV